MSSFVKRLRMVKERIQIIKVNSYCVSTLMSSCDIVLGLCQSVSF